MTDSITITEIPDYKLTDQHASDLPTPTMLNCVIIIDIFDTQD